MTIHNRNFLVTVTSFLVIGIVGEYFILDFFLFNYERLHLWWPRGGDAGPWPLVVAFIGSIVMSLIGGTGVFKYVRDRMWIK